MAKVRPIQPEHSINEVVFVLSFSQPLSEKYLQVLTQLEDVLKDKLPKMELSQGTGFKIQDGRVSSESSRLMAIAFRKFNEKGDFDWALRAENNFVAVNCVNYEGGWSKVWKDALEYLNLAASKLITPDNPVESISLQYVDRFIFEGHVNDYKTSTIFNDESVYLNKKVIGAGPFWHIHQGWFDYMQPLPSRVLNKLNITSSRADKEHHTTIDHSATVQFKSKITNHKTLFLEQIKDKASINYYFEYLHENNKKILQELLNDERITDIGL